MAQRSYKLLRDLWNINDIFYYVPNKILFSELPASVDLRAQCPPVRDQGQIGACTAFATTGMLGYDRIRQKLDLFPYSELFLYYNTREKEGHQNSDAGASIRDTIKCALKQGVCHEELWPYNEDHVLMPPAQGCYQDALLHRAVVYKRVPQNLIHMKAVLAGGYPFVIGISVYESFESEEVAKTGIVPMPKPGEKLLGGHAFMCCGYDSSDFIGQNSWGEWGDHGYFRIPADYLLHPYLSGDSWTIQQVD
jgi:C1A family cysteine protease